MSADNFCYPKGRIFPLRLDRLKTKGSFTHTLICFLEVLVNSAGVWLIGVWFFIRNYQNRFCVKGVALLIVNNLAVIPENADYFNLIAP